MERSNKGFKMLQGMGWREGEGLGRSNQGGTQPVPVQVCKHCTGTNSGVPRKFFFVMKTIYENVH